MSQTSSPAGTRQSSGALTELHHALVDTLSGPYSNSDFVLECGDAVLSLLPKRPLQVLKVAHQKLHSYPWKDVPECWRRCFTEASLWAVVLRLGKAAEAGVGLLDRLTGSEDGAEASLRDDDLLQDIVRLLDMAIIIAGAPGRDSLIHGILEELERMLREEEEGRRQGRLLQPPDLQNGHGHRSSNNEDCHRTTKRRRLNTTDDSTSLPSTFSETRIPHPSISHPIPSINSPSITSFTTHLHTPPHPTPLLLRSTLSSWPALTTHPWSSPSYLLSRTLTGRRLVPVEIGRSYTSPAWSQKILSIGTFIQTSMLPQPPTSPTPAQPVKPETVYLAQHDLLSQIPALRADILVPDYCYTDPPPARQHPPDTGGPVQKLETPLINAWFGPADTISPLHTDPYHNILAQVVGAKYVRLYAPSETAKLYPRGTGEDGVSFENTSGVDVEEMMELFEGSGSTDGKKQDGIGESECSLEQRRESFLARFPLAREAEYVECVLEAGECLYIPEGWWHYVRSLSASFSVSFWWN